MAVKVRRERGGSVRDILVLLALAVVAIYAATKLSDNDHSPQPAAATPALPDDSAGFRYACEELVKKRLVSPATAVFPGKDEWTLTKLGDNRYECRSWVDAKNKFGVPVRYNFTGVVVFDGVDYWSLDSLDMGE